MKCVLVMFMAVTMCISCTDSDDVNALVGTWEMAESIGGNEASIAIVFESDFTGKIVISVTIDGNAQTESTSFNWSTDGNKLIRENDGEMSTDTYFILGNRLTITDGEGIIMVLTKQ